MTKPNVANDLSNGQLEKDRPLLTDPVNRGSSTDDRSVPTSEPAGTDYDPFDPANLRLSQDYVNVSVKKALTRLPCRKPRKGEFVRTLCSDGWPLDTTLLEDPATGEMYLVQAHLRDEWTESLTPVLLFPAATKLGDFFLWFVKIPGPSGRTNLWNETAQDAAREAETRWVKVISNQAAGKYDIFHAQGAFPEPEWPALSQSEMLKLAFKDRFVTSHDHPVLKALRGEV